MRYLIADLVTEYTPLSEEFKAFLEPFSYDGDRATDITLRYTREDAESLLKKMVKETTFSQAESFGVSGIFNRSIIRHRAMLVHSSALICGGKAYLFSADSGVGKSTHTRLWLDAFGDEVHIMNDDKPVLRIYDDRILACGTPFDGGSGIALNETYPLGAIIFIERGEENSVRVPSDKEVIQKLYFQTARMVGPKTAQEMLINFDLLIGKAKFYILTCNMDISAAHTARREIIGGGVFVYKRIISYFMVLLIAFAAFLGNSPTVSAFGMDDLKSDSRMQLGYSIINGYSKLSARSGLTDYSKTAVYCGQDLSNPYLLALAGTFYFTNGVDLERTLTDNGYALGLVRKLNAFLERMGVKNERLTSLKAALKNEKVPVTESLDSVGLLFIKTDSAFAGRLMNDDRVDFVFAGGEVPPSMKDLNMDGRSDFEDASYIQRFLAGELVYPDADENEYIKFATDIDGDKNQDIRDATALLRDA